MQHLINIHVILSTHTWTAKEQDVNLYTSHDSTLAATAITRKETTNLHHLGKISTILGKENIEVCYGIWLQCCSKSYSTCISCKKI
jgi:Zn-dependent M28 family amino/carboxypeptidase